MSRRVVPLRKQNDAVWIQTFVLERIDAGDDRLLFKIDHCDRAIAHSGQVQKRILNERVAPIEGKRDVMRAFGSGYRFQKLRARLIGANVEDMKMAWLGGRH